MWGVAERKKTVAQFEVQEVGKGGDVTSSGRRILYRGEKKKFTQMPQKKKFGTGQQHLREEALRLEQIR